MKNGVMIFVERLDVLQEMKTRNLLMDSIKIGWKPSQSSVLGAKMQWLMTAKKRTNGFIVLILSVSLDPFVSSALKNGRIRSPISHVEMLNVNFLRIFITKIIPQRTLLFSIHKQLLLLSNKSLLIDYVLNVRHQSNMLKVANIWSVLNANVNFVLCV